MIAAVMKGIVGYFFPLYNKKTGAVILNIRQGMNPKPARVYKTKDQHVHIINILCSEFWRRLSQNTFCHNIMTVCVRAFRHARDYW